MKSTKNKKDIVLLEEEQRFSNWWIWGALILIFVFSLTDILYEILKKDVVTLTSIIPLIIFILIFGFIFTLFLFTRLQTVISSDGIQVKYFPINRKKTYLWNEIDNVYVRQYKPREFGGYGFRGTKKNRALNIYGNWGLQLEFKEGGKLLIGTQLPDEIELILKKIKKMNLA